MQNTRSQLETRLAQLLTTTPPRAVRRTPGHVKIDLAFLSEEDQHRLNSCVRE